MRACVWTQSSETKHARKKGAGVDYRDINCDEPCRSDSFHHRPILVATSTSKQTCALECHTLAFLCPGLGCINLHLLYRFEVRSGSTITPTRPDRTNRLCGRYLPSRA